MLPPEIVIGIAEPLQLAEYTGFKQRGSTSKWLKLKLVGTPIETVWLGTVEDGYTFNEQSRTIIE
jgi:hypothetical protein